jgi:hypothetical protein
MRTVYGSYSVEVRDWDSVSGMRAAFLPGSGAVVEVGCDECVDDLRSVTVSDSVRSDRSVHVLICSQGLAPEMWLPQTEPVVAVGCNSSVTYVDIGAGGIRSAVTLPFVFYRFLPIASPQHILALHELGVMMLDCSGNVLWRYDSDGIIESCEVWHGSLVVRLMSGEKVELALPTEVSRLVIWPR